MQRERRTLASELSPGRLGAELRQAWRALRAASWYSAASVVVVALGMMLATAVFALVDGVLFKPLPYDNPDEIVAVGGEYTDVPGRPATLTRPGSPIDYWTWSDAIPEVEFTAIVHYRTELADGEYAPAANVTSNFLDVFGVEPFLGEGFDEETFERRDPRPALISYGFWQGQFGGDPNVIGQIYRRHTQTGASPPPGTEIIGVMAEDFVFPTQPTRPPPDIIAGHTLGRQSGERYLTLFGRLGPVSRIEVEARLVAAAKAYQAVAPPIREIPGQSPQARRLREPYDTVVVYPIRQYLTVLQRPMFAVVMAMAAVLGLLACVSVGGLSTARMHDRGPQLTVRRALGAGRWDLARVVLIENGVLVLAGTVVGVALAGPALRLAASALPDTLPLPAASELEWRAFGFAALAAVASIAAVSWWPIRTVGQLKAPNVLRAGSMHTTRERSLGRTLLVSVQTALALVLLLGGALLVASFLTLWQRSPGFNTANSVVFQMALGTIVPPSRANDMAADIRGLPDVAGAGAFYGSFLEGQAGGSRFLPPPGVDVNPISPTSLLVGGGFLEATGPRLIDGRLPSVGELDTGQRVVAVSESLAEWFWPDAPAVGQTLGTGRGNPYAVVGVVEDSLFDSLDADPAGRIYHSLLDSPNFTRASMFVNFEPGQPRDLEAVMDVVARVQPGARVVGVRFVDEAMADSVRSRRFQTLVFSAFATAALVVLAAGIFGLVAMTTSRRTREIGLRMALGASRRHVVGLLIREQMLAVLIGLAAGAVVATWAAGFIEADLFGLSTTNLEVWSLGAATIVVVTLAGTLVPSWRASRVDPVSALRTE